MPHIRRAHHRSTGPHVPAHRAYRFAPGPADRHVTRSRAGQTPRPGSGSKGPEFHRAPCQHSCPHVTTNATDRTDARRGIYQLTACLSDSHNCQSDRMAARMKQLTLLVVISHALLAQNAPTSGPPTGEQHEFIIANFHTESGVTLPQARIVYATYGRLKAEKNNVVLLPSHYMANFHGYERR